MAKGDKLSPKQELFVQEYLVDLNATAAYRRAGYKAKTDAAARASASEILTNPNVQSAIQAAQAQRSERTKISADWVLERLKANADRSMQAVQATDSEGEPTGEYRYEGSVANRALELIGKHLGMFAERHVHTGEDGGDIKISVYIPDNGRNPTAAGRARELLGKSS